MIEQSKKLKLVGEFIRKRRESLRMSQRALGQLFSPPVSTQFISNVERGVTPLPPVHVPVLAKALMSQDAEIMSLLEREYAVKLTGRLGKSVEEQSIDGNGASSLSISGQDYAFMRSLYDAFRVADPQTRQAFATVCESILKVQRSSE